MARDAIEQIDLTTRLMKQYNADFEFAHEPEDVERIYGEGKIAFSIGIEGYVFTSSGLAWVQVIKLIDKLAYGRELDWYHKGFL